VKEDRLCNTSKRKKGVEGGLVEKKKLRWSFLIRGGSDFEFKDLEEKHRKALRGGVFPLDRGVQRKEKKRKPKGGMF